jgi:hypothetical protein
MVMKASWSREEDSFECSRQGLPRRATTVQKRKEREPLISANPDTPSRFSQRLCPEVPIPAHSCRVVLREMPRVVQFSSCGGQQLKKVAPAARKVHVCTKLNDNLQPDSAGRSTAPWRLHPRVIQSACPPLRDLLTCHAVLPEP